MLLAATYRSGAPSPGADVAGLSPVPAQMWQGWADWLLRQAYYARATAPYADGTVSRAAQIESHGESLGRSGGRRPRPRFPTLVAHRRMQMHPRTQALAASSVGPEGARRHMQESHQES